MALAALLALSAGEAEAHGNHFPKRDTLTLSPGRLSLAIRLDFDAGDESTGIRDRFDRNADGRLDSEELSALQRYLGTEAQRHAVVRVDEVTPALMVTARSVYGVEHGTRSPDPLGVNIVLEGPLPTSDTVHIELSDQGRDLGREVPVTVRVLHAAVQSHSAGRSESEAPDRQWVRGIYLAPGEVLSLVVARQHP